MLTIILLFGLALGVIAGVVISVQARKRSDGRPMRPNSTVQGGPTVRRANGPLD